jgi:hypothetical protein
MSKIPTAQEFISKILTDFWEGGKAQYRGEDVAEVMIEFAKLHVEAQQEAILEKAEALNQAKFKGDCNPQIDAESIINAYPLTNIK